MTNTGKSPSFSKLVEATKTPREEANDIRAEVWEAALRAAAGNLTRAGEAMGFSPQRGYALCRRYDLQDLAAQLREAAGQPPRGRPRTR